MFCKNCGKKMPDDTISCQNCGTPTNNVVDTNNIGYLCLGCCIPVAGIALYFAWKDQKPLNAKKCIQGFFMYLFFCIIYIFIYALIIISSSMYY